MGIAARIAQAFGYVKKAEPVPGLHYRATYAGAQQNRLTADWLTQTISPDMETAAALTLLRNRSRQLVNNNDYAKRVVNLIRQNVVGPEGLRLQARITDEQDNLAPEANRELERAFRRWSKRKNCSVDGRLSFSSMQALAVATLAVDGEVFLRKVKGFDNPFGYALQFVDADRIPVTYRRYPELGPGGNLTNEIRMGIEVDRWQRPVAYYISKRHPSEGGGVMGAIYDRIPAGEIIHIYLALRPATTRGVPIFHSAMLRMHMLGQYEEAELMASRIAACMGVFFTSKTGDDYAGTKDPNTGAVEIAIEPAMAQQLPEGVKPEVFNPTHPNQNYPEFKKGMLHGSAAGANVSYASMTGDLRDVNFSSIRQGVLDERDGYRMLQGELDEQFCDPVFEGWLDMALLTGQLRMPSPLTDEARQMILDAVTWRGRGWSWVDPLKDAQAQILSVGAGFKSRHMVCAEMGVEFEDVLEELAREQQMAKEKGVQLGADIKKPQGEGEPIDSNPGSSGGTS